MLAVEIKIRAQTLKFLRCTVPNVFLKSLCIKSKDGKIRTRKNPIFGNFMIHHVVCSILQFSAVLFAFYLLIMQKATKFERPKFYKWVLLGYCSRLIFFVLIIHDNTDFCIWAVIWEKKRI